MGHIFIFQLLLQDIIYVRKEKGITREELVFQSGLALSQIVRIKTGRLNTCICTLAVLAKTLEVDPGELLRRI
jgi:transcriptional regulator with XRE-family HTH domain